MENQPCVWVMAKVRELVVAFPQDLVSGCGGAERVDILWYLSVRSLSVEELVS
jgi:hypothetical protein